MRATRRRLAAALVVAALGLLPAPRPAMTHQERAMHGAGRPFLAPEPPLPAIRKAPDFALIDTEGRRARLASLRGRVVLVGFLYTSCTAACPLLSARLAALQRALREIDPEGRRVAILSVTVDPARDTAAALRAYGARFGADPARWRFLREAPDRLAPVLAAYGEWARRTPAGEVDHPARLHLVDADGQVREIYGLSFFDERQALLDIRRLLREARDRRR